MDEPPDLQSSVSPAEQPARHHSRACRAARIEGDERAGPLARQPGRVERARRDGHREGNPPAIHPRRRSRLSRAPARPALSHLPETRGRNIGLACRNCHSARHGYDICVGMAVNPLTVSGALRAIAHLHAPRQPSAHNKLNPYISIDYRHRPVARLTKLAPNDGLVSALRKASPLSDAPLESAGLKTRNPKAFPPGRTGFRTLSAGSQ